MPQDLKQHLSEIEARLWSKEKVFLCLDYDGTMTPIVQRPEDAQLHPDMRMLLQNAACCKRFQIAIVSGRALSDLQHRVGMGQLDYVGNHGLEIAGPGLHYCPLVMEDLQKAIQRCKARLESTFLSIPGCQIEDKKLTLSLHYRRVAPEHKNEFQARLKIFLNEIPDTLQVMDGHCVVDIRPNIHWHKGKACLWLREARGLDDALTIYIGDDRTDEDAFQMLLDGITVKVGASEVSAAHYFLADPNEVKWFLDWLVFHTAVKNM